ncbi:TatD family hydrolase [Neptunitalea chrysea]|uniref:TatD family hydrolase n=1 Tax=Neptunitalea chrysea TaxID=1647581 RepID=A0A9W6EUB5_9FLAO|nr:TatD family hydrolase [Neptunitalea chrysea]GLB51127.1 TatD family hydrolase [Neptunitalea chrysea]
MHFIDIHTHSEITAESNVTIVNKLPQDTVSKGYFSVGYHPWYLKANEVTNQFELLTKKALSPFCLAVGECGLDKVVDTDYNLQLSVFKDHIALSETLQKPLIIHCVKSFQEIYQLKKELKPSQQWILHGFTKNEQLANQMVSAGFKLSFGAALFKNSSVQRTFANLLPESFFLETDDQLGISIKAVYEKAAALRNVNIEEIQQIITKNFKEVFKV